MDWGWSQDYSPGGHSSKCWFLISQYRFPVFGSPHVFRKFPRNFRNFFQKFSVKFYFHIYIPYPPPISHTHTQYPKPWTHSELQIHFSQNVIFSAFARLFPTPFMYVQFYQWQITHEYNSTGKLLYRYLYHTVTVVELH